MKSIDHLCKNMKEIMSTNEEALGKLPKELLVRKFVKKFTV
jgi:hypothetical protein